MLVLKKEYLLNQSISNEGLLVLLALSSIRRTKKDIHFTVNHLAVQVTDEEVLSARVKKYVSRGIQNLITNNVITIKRVIDKHDYYISCNDIVINTETERYLLVSEEELKAVVALDKSQLGILRYYLVIISSINYSKKYWFTPVDIIASVSNISKGSAMSYNKQLEEAKLLYIHRVGKVIYSDATETFSKLCNAYGRYEDRGQIIKANTEHFNAIVGAMGKNHLKVHPIKNRSVKASYNHFSRGIKNGKEYTQEYIDNLYEKCQLYNELNKGYSDMEQLDLSIFQIREMEGDGKSNI